MKCRVCSKESRYLFDLKVLNKYKVKYYKCDNCKFIQTEKPYWLDEAYSSAIANADTGLLQRNFLLSRKVAAIIYFLFNKKDKFLDFAGGYGVFTRLMRDIGFDFYWDDIYADNLFAKGFSDIAKEYEIVTAFEVYEHIQDPIKETKNIFDKHNTSALIFSTLLYNEPIDKKWWYFTPSTGQHVSIYNKETLEYIANKLNLYLYTDNKNVHMFSKKKFNTLQAFLMSNISLPLSLYVQLRMKSRTFSDHLDIVNKSK